MAAFRNISVSADWPPESSPLCGNGWCSMPRQGRNVPMTNTDPAQNFVAQLPGDVSIPLLGFGTWQLRGDSARDAVSWALEAGYRHLDTATAYGNETQVGAAVRESDLAREDVFITTKLPPDHA